MDDNCGDDNLLRGFNWVCWVPIKINCFVWHVISIKVHVAKYFAIRGIVLNHVTCSFCNSDDEEVDHIFFKYSFPAQIWSWYVSYNGMSSSIPKNKMELLEMLVALVTSKKKKKS